MGDSLQTLVDLCLSRLFQNVKDEHVEQAWWARKSSLARFLELVSHGTTRERAVSLAQGAPGCSSWINPESGEGLGRLFPSQ